MNRMTVHADNLNSKFLKEYILKLHKDKAEMKVEMTASSNFCLT